VRRCRRSGAGGEKGGEGWGAALQIAVRGQGGLQCAWVAGDNPRRQGQDSPRREGRDAQW
jgi:hypothetical protein